MDAKVMQAKEHIVNYVNEELNQGVPPSVLALILETMAHNLESTAIQFAEKQMAEEFENQQKNDKQNQNGLKEVFKNDKNTRN